MDELQARFVVEYEYMPEASMKCRATVKLYLPAEPDTGYLVEALIDPDTNIFGSQLSSVWGFRDNECRYSEYTLKAKTWDELESKICDLMDETVSKLRTIRAMNEIMEKKKPRDKEVIFPI